MTDRLKVSLFDTLAPYGIGGASVLDLYAGSGSLGIEMLSRGAEYAHFVEQNAAVCRIIRENLEGTKLSERARIFQMPVERFLSLRGVKPAGVTGAAPVEVDSATEYDIILLDPPYADPTIMGTLERVALSSMLVGDGILIIGHANRVKLDDTFGGGRLLRVKHRAMGDSAFSIYEARRSQTGSPFELDTGD